MSGAAPVQGGVWLPHGWTQPNVGWLTSSQHDIDPLTGMVLLSGVAVEIEPVGDLERIGYQ
jgi:hypothetical protein